MKQPTQVALEEALRRSWCARTSADPGGWRAWCPEHGQCAVTALVLQDYLGGTLCRCLVEVEEEGPPVSHYYHRDPEGKTTDPTWSQFPVSARTSSHEERARRYVLSFPNTLRRYLELRDRVEELLRGE